MNPQGASLFLTGIILLVIPGMVFNNLNNSGLINNSVAQTCSTNPAIPTCVLSTPVGCQVSAANCNLNGSTISFFTKTSPFTGLLNGNILGLFTNLQGPANSQASGAQTTPLFGQTHYPFDLTGNPNYISVNCPVTNATNGTGGKVSQKHLAISGGCTQTSSDNQNVTEPQATTWNNWNTQLSGISKTIQFFHLGNGTYPATCVFIAQINYTALNNGPGFTYYGCSIGTPLSNINAANNPLWGWLLAIPLTMGTFSVGYQHLFIFAQPENWHTADCFNNVNQGNLASQGCTNFLAGFQGINIPGTTNSYVPSTAGAVIGGFLMGLVLLIAGLGLQFGVGGGVSAGINPQGTKLAQALGIGLILWSIFFSEFDGWFTSGYLPYGLDGLAGGVSLAISALVFVGVYLLSQGGGSAETPQAGIAESS